MHAANHLTINWCHLSTCLVKYFSSLLLLTNICDGSLVSLWTGTSLTDRLIHRIERNHSRAFSSRVTSVQTTIKNNTPHKHACTHNLIFFRCAQRELFMLKEQVILMLLCNREKSKSCERLKRIWLSSCDIWLDFDTRQSGQRIFPRAVRPSNRVRDNERAGRGVWRSERGGHTHSRVPKSRPDSSDN